MPSGEVSVMPASSASCKPDTRIMKNSSRLEEKIARNLSCSSKGCRASKASSSTRRLNSNQLNSRLRSRCFWCLRWRGKVPFLPLGCLTFAAAEDIFLRFYYCTGQGGAYSNTPKNTAATATNPAIGFKQHLTKRHVKLT